MRDQLEGMYKANKIEQLKLSAELVRIHKIFSSKQIDLISFKGPILSARIYKDPSERTSRDLDFLIHEDQLDDALLTLQNIGYELQTLYSSPKQKEAIVRYYHHMELYHPDQGVHCRITLETDFLKELFVQPEQRLEYGGYCTLFRAGSSCFEQQSPYCLSVCSRGTA